MNFVSTLKDYLDYVSEWRRVYHNELVSDFKITAILRDNYPMIDVDNLSDEKYMRLVAEYFWVREIKNKTVNVTS